MSITFTVRTAVRGDIAAIDALLARSYPKLLKADYPPSVLVLALPLISRAQPGLIASGSYYVAETEAGAIIGAGGWTRRRQQRDVGDIRHLVTDDRHTRQGIASAILRASVTVASATGVRLLDCKATRTAVPFYAAMGFEVLGEITVPLRPGIDFPAIHMQRRL